MTHRIVRTNRTCTIVARLPHGGTVVRLESGECITLSDNQLTRLQEQA